VLGHDQVTDSGVSPHPVEVFPAASWTVTATRRQLTESTDSAPNFSGIRISMGK
jgi:hypothetical protein